MAAMRENLNWVMSSIALVLASALVGSFMLPIIATNPNWDSGPISFYIFLGAMVGIPSALSAGILVAGTEYRITRGFIVLGFSVLAAVMSFFFAAITAGGA